MGSIWLGSKRTFETKGIAFSSDQTEFSCRNEDSDLRVSIYVGRVPKFGIKQVVSDRYADPLRMDRFRYSLVLNPAPELSNYVGSLFVEIWAVKRVEVTAEFLESLSDTTKGREALTEALAMVQGDLKDEIEAILDSLVGSLGLRIHRQLVLVLNDACNLCFLDLEKAAAYNTEGPVIENLEALALSEAVESLVQGMVNETAALRAYNKPLQWLALAWQEETPVTRFLALFTALETLLNQLPPPKTFVSRKPDYKKIRKLIETCPDRDERKTLLDLFNRMAEKELPSLFSRFESLAKEVAMPGWEHDISAFERFNKQRNNLVHRGDARVSTRLDVTEGEVRDLEDLTERYVCSAIFGDTNVYYSRFRVSNKPTETP